MLSHGCRVSQLKSSQPLLNVAFLGDLVQFFFQKAYLGLQGWFFVLQFILFELGI